MWRRPKNVAVRSPRGCRSVEQLRQESWPLSLSCLANPLVSSPLRADEDPASRKSLITSTLILGDSSVPWC
jgi:hypothetical protein